MVVAALVDGSFDPAAYAVISIVAWVAALAGLVGRGLPSGPVARPAVIAGLCLAGGVVLGVASMAWAGDQGRAFNEAVRASAYLGVFTLAACTASPGGRRCWIAGLTVGLAVVATLAVASRLQPELFPEPGPLLASAASRLSYPVGYWNALGALLASALVLLAAAGVRAADPRLRASAIAAMPIAVLGIAYTTSSGAVIAAAAGLTVLVAAAADRPRQLTAAVIGCAGGAAVILATSGMNSLADGLRDSTARTQGDWASLILLATVLLTAAAARVADAWEPRLRPSAPLRAGLATVAAVGLLAAVAIADPSERLREFKQPPPPTTARAVDPGGNALSGSGRWQFWEAAVDAWESEPVVGVGAGAYEDWWAQHASVGVFVRNPHSLPLQQLAELGLLGGGLLLGFVGALALAAWRSLSARREDAGVLVGVLAAAAVAAAIDWSWAVPAVFAPAVAAAGLLSASAPGEAPGGERYALGITTGAFAWVALVMAGLVVLAELKLDQSRGQARDGDLAAAVERAEEARTVQPWSAEPSLQLALLDELGGDLGGALEELEEAKELDAEDWRLPYIEARLQFARGDAEAGREALRRARALSPRAPVFRERPG